MAVIGIDFGNDSCVVSVWKNGKIDIVTTESNFRYTPTWVAFGKHKREFGNTAKNQWSKNADSTVFDLKILLDVKRLRKRIFNLLDLIEIHQDSISFYVSLLGQKFNLNPCQILAMLFAKIKTDAEEFLEKNEKITGCVIAVPVYFNDQERKEVLVAAGLARLDCHFLIKETTAVAINYSLYKTFAKPVNVIFIDFGHSSIQVSACKFEERRLEVIEEVSELIGGRDIDEILADFIIDTMITSANRRSKTFCIQVLQAVEQLKKKMSFSVDYIPLELKVSPHDGPIVMRRAQMERICSSVFTKVEQLMRLCLERSRLRSDEISAIEMVGGSTRIPIVVTLAEKVFGKVPISTMSRDDSVARGCLLKSIMNAKRRGYKIVEKPFDDICFVDIYNSGFKDLVRVFQVHRYLKSDCRDSFNLTETEFLGYVETEKKIIQHEFDEEKRLMARDKLAQFLLEQMQPDGVLENCEEKIKNEIDDTMDLKDGTIDQLTDLLHYWRQKIDKLKKKKQMRAIEAQRDNDCDGTTTDDNKERQSSGVKKLTFKDCDEVKLIEKCERTGRSTARFPTRRKGLRSGYRRLNKIAPSELACSKNDGGHTLLHRQRERKKKPIVWCCFL